MSHLLITSSDTYWNLMRLRLQQDIHSACVADLHFDQHLAIGMAPYFDGSKGWNTLTQGEACEVETCREQQPRWFSCEASPALPVKTRHLDPATESSQFSGWCSLSPYITIML